MNLYDALSLAETGGEENPWIRTKVNPIDPETGKKKGSTAFGPVQITKGLIENAIKNKVFTPETLKFVNEVMIPMQTSFIKYGAEDMIPGKEMFDYGQTGGFDVDTYEDAYKKMANELIQHELKRTMTDGNVNLGAFLKEWRGREPEKRYKKRFYKGLKKKGSHYGK